MSCLESETDVLKMPVKVPIMENLPSPSECSSGNMTFLALAASTKAFFLPMAMALLYSTSGVITTLFLMKQN